MLPLMQVEHDAGELATSVVLDVLGKPGHQVHGDAQLLNRAAIQEGAPSLVVVYIGTQMRSSDARKPAKQAVLSRLGGILQASKSWASLPFVQARAPLHSELSKALAAAQVAVQSVGCGGAAPADLAQVVAQAAAARAQVLMACSSAGSLQEELEQVATLQSAASQLGTSYLFLLASQGNSADSDSVLPGVSPSRRSLLANDTAPAKGFGKYTTCGDLCRIQVAWLEGLLALLLLVLAACAGLTCLHVLDTPTRFESSKDAVKEQ